MKYITLVFVLTFTSASAQLTAPESESIDKGLDELCTCVNEILGSFDPAFQEAFIRSMNGENGKTAIQDYFVKLDSTQKSNLKKELGEKIINPDSEFTRCGKMVAQKYNVNLNTSSSEQKQYYLERLRSIDKCKVLSMMIPQSKPKQ